MRRVIYSAAVSLDGFIAGPDGSVDWLHFSADVQAYMREFWGGIDTIVMGRKTFVAAAGPPAPTKGHGTRTPRRKKNAAGPFAAMTSYVFSHTLTEADYPDARIVASDAVAFVRAMKSKEGRDICVMGGGEFARSLLAGGVVDQVDLNVHPVLLGRGVPFFRDAGMITLGLHECRRIDGGCVLARYNVDTRATT